MSAVDNSACPVGRLRRHHLGQQPGKWSNWACHPPVPLAFYPGYNGGTGQANNASTVQQWSVSPAAWAGVRIRYPGRLRPEGFLPSDWQRPACGRAKWYAKRARHQSKCNASSLTECAALHERRASPAIDRRIVRLRRSTNAVWMRPDRPSARQAWRYSSADPRQTR